ncbi:hypothetical protein ACLOJK_009856 [Asimina triloba]
MISNSDQILYACVSKGTTVLADLCSGDPDLETLASQCLEKTPEFHGFYSHTLRKRMYCFLIDNPLIYFAVVDEDLGKPQVLEFLSRLKDAFAAIEKKKRLNSSDQWTYRCFQEDFDPVFSRLVQRRNSVNVSASDASASARASVRKSISTEAPLLANQEGWYDDDAMEDVALDSNASRELSRELSWEISREISRQMSQKMSQKMSGRMSHQMMSNRQMSGLQEQQETPERSQEEVSVSMRKGIPCMGNESLRQSAWRSWKRQVFIALAVDFLLCCMLLGVWLAVCNGFRCTKN